LEEKLSEGGLDQARTRVQDELERLERRSRRLGQDLHRMPELGCREYHTVIRIAGELEEEGFEVTTGLAGLSTAFRAELAGPRGGEGPCIAFLVEYDAVPNLGHTCGHNLVVVAAYRAAVALARGLGDALPGRIAVIGAPAEETIGGKVVLSARGGFDDVDVALLAHPGARDRVAVRSLASWSVEVVFRGRSAHAVAAPELGRNALDALIQLFVARDALLKGLLPEVRVPGVILEGGVRPNVVPDRARARFSLRAAEADYLVGTVYPRFCDAAEGVARATGTEVSITPVDNLYDEMLNNPVLVDTFAGEALRAGWTLAGEDDGRRAFGSLDMGTVSRRVPSLHPLFAITDGPEPLATHTEAFTQAANAEQGYAGARRAALALAWTGLVLLGDPRRLDEVRRAHGELASRAPRPADVPIVTEPPGES
jgi:amidohydrolase